jgi:hypothetical protein
LIAVAVLGGCTHEAAPAKTSGSEAFDDFAKRVAEYTEMHKRVAAKLPELPEKASPQQIRAHEDALAAALIAARPNAKQGDFFTPSVRTAVLDVVRREFEGPAGKNNKKVIADDNATTKSETPIDIKLAVNKRYPDGASLSTVPPSMLKNLPRLPEELEYRFAGRHLILYSTTANMILDFVPNALPPLQRGASN